MEGNVSNIKRQAELLRELSVGCLSILEIGFNGGHSAAIFLKNQDCHVLSFDIGTHGYIWKSKRSIDGRFPGRHNLIIGDSRTTVPQYAEQKPDKKFDLIFIDGGHEYGVARMDFLNCRKMADEKTILVMDDTVYKLRHRKTFHLGPTKVWEDALRDEEVIELGREEFPPRPRGMSWGKFKS